MLRSLFFVFQLVLAIPALTAPPEPKNPPTVPMPNPAVIQPKTPATDAEKIANARDSIRQATEARDKLQARLDDPEGEYHKAEKEFEELNTKLKTDKMSALKLRNDGHEAEAAKLETAIEKLEIDWKLAKDRFDIAIRKKKATQDTIAGLEDRIVTDQRLLDRLEGKTPPAPPAPVPAPMPANPPVASVPNGTAPAAVQPVAPEKQAKSEVAPAPVAVAAVPGVPTPASTVTPAAQPIIALPAPNENDPAIVHARRILESRREELREVEGRVRIAEEQVRVAERSIENAQKMMNLEQEAVDQAEKFSARMSEELRSPEVRDMTAQEELAKKLTDAEQRLADSRSRVKRIADRIVTQNETLAGLKSELEIVNKEAEAKRERVKVAESELATLLSPTSLRNLFRWILAKGPRLLFIILGMGVVHLLARQFSRHIVGFITRNSQRGSPLDRENRASTLVGVFRYVAAVLVFGGGLVMLLDEIGVPVVPLMGGAAVIGLAVAFGAQNLIRDYFTGFMMLMEDQYSVNDVVRIGSIAGQVEQITLRMTVLRDLEGIRHFIPHGTITSVSNLTHGWSRALIDIPVAYKENVDRVIVVLTQLGKEMRHHPELGAHIVEDPEMLGVDELGDSGVVVRFLIKTRPLKQWPIKREMLRRIKNRFDELGIEIPFPHRTVYHHMASADASGVLPVSNPMRVVA